MRCLNELGKDGNLEQRFEAVFKEKMWDEYKYVTDWIDSCNIPITFCHADLDAKNMIFDKETGRLLWWTLNLQTHRLV